MARLRIGAYLRLSKDDGMGNVESNSITSQRIIINQYITNNLQEVDSVTEYVDDGYTGLTFDRPAMKKLLQAIDEKEINCVIVKDLSRFGRDYLETGRYVFNDFLLSGIRFIAVNDNYDTWNTNSAESFMMPMKTMLNNYYSIDISDKVKRAFKAKQTAGQFTGAFTSYGYMKDGEDRHVLKIDENVAPVVRRIFSLFIEGNGKQTIARILNNEGIPCPTAYKQLMGQKYCNNRKLQSTNYWTYATIHKILTNEMYIGNMVLNKYDRVKPRARARKNSPDKWIITESTHEPIISKDTWEITQVLLHKRGRQLDFRKIGLFAGFIECGDCQRAMAKIQYKKSNGMIKYRYICGSYKRYGSGVCTRHAIEEEVLEKAVLAKLNEYIAKSSIIIEGLNEQQAENESIVSRNNTLIETIKIKKKKLYESYANGIITLEEYQDYKKDYEAEERKYHTLIEQSEQQEDTIENEKVQWLKKLQAQKKIEKLDREILVETLDKIYVYEEKGEIRVEIRFRFVLD